MSSFSSNPLRAAAGQNSGDGHRATAQAHAFLTTFTILPIEINGYIMSQSGDEAGGEFHNHGSPAAPRQRRVDSCLGTIVMRLPNLSAPKELPAAQPSACCRHKAWFQLPTGSHKPLLGGGHF